MEIIKIYSKFPVLTKDKKQTPPTGTLVRYRGNLAVVYNAKERDSKKWKWPYKSKLILLGPESLPLTSINYTGNYKIVQDFKDFTIEYGKKMVQWWYDSECKIISPKGYVDDK